MLYLQLVFSPIVKRINNILHDKIVSITEYYCVIQVAKYL